MMRTDDLINLLVTGEGTVARRAVAERYLVGLVSGGFFAALLMTFTLGVNPALSDFVWRPMFWVKLAFVASLATIGWMATLRMSRPGQKLGRLPSLLTAPVLALWTLSLIVLVQSAPGDRPTLFFGETWSVCPLLVTMLSAPIFAGIIWAMKGFAPTRLRLAGAIAGFLSGSAGALIYCLHCPELAAPFIGFWYLLGILLPTLFGALAGNRLLRW